MKSNRPELIKKRKQLRNNSTPAECELWNYLKGKKVCRLKFRRQYSVGKYVLDFYCPELKLAIELDG
ncbi:endonuclease domain-containing protein, partial [Labilibacter marinus]|uniref:endonuclease domain-containing protein n=1 Tax=Labilibacter marinus TaxID=1477105 RepID=UPI00117BC98E